MEWLKERINRDNFWNLMFWVGVTISVLVTELLVYSFEIGLLGLILFIISMTIVPYIIASFNKVKYIEGKIFLNAKNKDLSAKLPKKFSIVFLINFILSVFIYVPYVLLDNKGVAGMPFTTTAALIFALPTLYFIYLNCPISILFTNTAWKLGITGFDKNAKHVRVRRQYQGSNMLQSPLRESTITGSSYAGLSSNINNSNHGRK